MELLSVSRSWRRASLIVALAAGAAAIALWYFSTRLPPVPQRALRIGFESNPPVQIRTENGFSGLAIETVNEAAKRAGIKLEWVETGTSSDEAFRKGMVDLWPLMVDLPDRRKRVHFARPWMHSSNVLLLRDGSPNPGRHFKGRIAVFKLPLLVRVARGQFPEASIVEIPDVKDILKQVCEGADAGFLEARVASTLLREKSQECPSMTLRVQTIPGLMFNAGLASTFESAGAADQIQGEIDNMFRNGILASLIAKYSYFGLDDTWATYEQMEAERRWQWLAWTIGGLVFALGLTLWQASSLRQRKRAVLLLSESEENFRNLANTAPVMIVASGLDGKATFFNRVWLDFTGRPIEDQLGSGWIEDVHPEDRDHVIQEYSASLETRENCKLEYRLRRADGEYRHILCTGVPRFKQGQGFDGFIASCIDLTDVKRAEEEALFRQKLESVGTLAGGIAHDFNNLLGAVQAQAELGLSELDTGSSCKEELNAISAVAMRGSEIVRQLMIYAGKESGDVGPVDLSKTVEEMLSLLKVSVTKHAVIEAHLDHNLPSITADAAQLRQIVMNLITNASDAIGDRDGVIRVITRCVSLQRESGASSYRTLPDGEFVELEVSDTGRGMSPQTQAKVFDPFFTTKSLGRGLGLAVVQGIVRSLGGTIQLATEPDQGTTFRVLLPSAKIAAAAGGQAISGGEHTAVPSQHGTILVVEDEDQLRQGIVKMLRKAGFEVFEAAEGSSAIKLLRGDGAKIDVVLLDMTMAGASSQQIIAEAVNAKPDIKLILTSAYSQEMIASSMSAPQIHGFIRKPFQFADLLKTLRSSLSS